MTNREAPLVALGPSGSPGWLEEAIRDGGGEVVGLAECEAIVWADARNAAALADAIDEAPNLRWVQLPFAGIENFTEFLDDDYTWTCAKGVYAEPVAELALTLGIAGLRNVGTYAKSTSWSGPAGRNLLGGRVTIVGGGGITESLVRLLQPWDCHITVVRNHVQHMDGVDDVLESDRFADALPGADLIVLALSLTPETEGLIGRDEFEMMEDHAWVVNVARGRHIITEHLVEALQNNTIGGAGLDVTEPEPLPDDHPLWSLPNCIITPHVGNTPEMAKPLLAARVTENVRRYRKGEDLLGLIDVEAGY